MDANADAVRAVDPVVHSETSAARELTHFALPTRLATFVSFDRQVAATAFHQRPDRYRHLEASLGSAPRIARGGGYSYAAASFGAGVVVQEMTAFSRILSFDGMSRRVSVEAGIRMGDLLRWATRRGLYLPVVPGHPLITVGGCVAADVHGKNPWSDGTFGDWVLELTLYRPGNGFVQVSKESSRELFDATCGGFGLTGVIVSAVLQLAPIPAPRMALRGRTVCSFAHAAELLAKSNAAVAYTWHPGRIRRSAFGKGLLFEGRWSDGSSARESVPEQEPADVPGMLDAFPMRLWTPLTLAVASGAFALRRKRPRNVSFFEVCFPLARQNHYHRFFGPRGLCELQVLIPLSTLGDFSQRFETWASAEKVTIAFASMKRFRGTSAALGLCGEGLLFTADYVPSSRHSAARLDRLLLETGAQPNLAKHSGLARSVAEQCVVGVTRFRDLRRRIDPERLFQSHLSRCFDV